MLEQQKLRRGVTTVTGPDGPISYGPNNGDTKSPLSYQAFRYRGKAESRGIVAAWPWRWSSGASHLYSWGGVRGILLDTPWPQGAISTEIPLFPTAIDSSCYLSQERRLLTGRLHDDLIN